MNHKFDKVLVHIGYHKSASSWLQQKLFSSESKIFISLSRKKTGTSSLAKKFIYDNEKYLLSPFDDNEAEILTELKSITENDNSFSLKIPVLSDERLSGNPHSGGFDSKKIAGMIKNIFPRAQILIVIREQKSIILSMYFQYLSVGGTNSLEKYLNTRYDGKRPHFSPNHINYLPLVKEYYASFGNENVLVLPYEMFRDQPSVFMSKLGNLLKVDIGLEKNVFNEYVNKKRNKYLAYYLRALNALRKSNSVNNYSVLSNRSTRKVANAIFSILGRVTPQRLDGLITKRAEKIIASWVGVRYSKSNKELSKLIGIDLSDYGYY
jgi:hypothetical protein